MTSKSLIWFVLDQSSSDNLNRTNTLTQKRQTPHKDNEQNNVALRRRNYERKNEIDVKITYFNKNEREKHVREMIFDKKIIIIKLSINHPSLKDDGE